MITYRTKEGDMVDAICYSHYGTSKDTTEAVYEANRDLADYGPRLPAGLLITLPERTVTTPESTVHLWE